MFTDGVIRTTIQSLVDVGHAPAGMVTEANPSADVIVVADVALVFPSVAGGIPEPDHTVKAMRNGPDLPLESVNVPARTCRPSLRAPVLYVMCVPLTTGATVETPSRITPDGVAASLVTSSTELTALAVAASAGVDETTRGAVLSTRTLVRTLADVLPNESVTTARKSYRPSVSDVVSTP